MKAKYILDAVAIKANADELLGAEQMLATFLIRYGHLPQFAGVVAAIYLVFHQAEKEEAA